MKGIADPIHGTIQLNDLEARVVSTRAFQRLRNVKQLGLANMVFPAADYSRFSHSVGVCHITQRIISALRASGVPFTQREEQQYRLAGLLHDIGHYPYSHAMEEAVKTHYSALVTEGLSAPHALASDGRINDIHLPRWLDHERVGKEVLRLDEEINQTLLDAGFPPEDIYRVFAREEPPRFANLISSDLDADRIDYLLRTAHHTGLPYGAVDLDYMLSQLRVDESDHICLHPKALRTADHFLIGRHFDYQQVAFHKTVVAFEWILKDVLRASLKEGVLTCTAANVQQQIRGGQWASFDDARILQLIRDLVATTQSEVTRLKAKSILDRRPPRLLVQVEYLDGRGRPAKDLFLKKKLILQHVGQWAESFDLEPDLWHVWDRALTFTKVGSSVPISALADDVNDDSADPEKTEQAVRILDPIGNTSRPIMNEPRSLMSVLADRALYSVRVYALLPPGREIDRARIAQRIRSDLPEMQWSP